jgi:hypothetical protein
LKAGLLVLAAAVAAMPAEGSARGLTVSEWMAIDRWSDCARLARPGTVFELRNAQGLSLFAPCTALPPALPFGWKSPPLRFRAVPQTRPEHSTPIPPPAG